MAGAGLEFWGLRFCDGVGTWLGGVSAFEAEGKRSDGWVEEGLVGVKYCHRSSTRSGYGHHVLPIILSSIG